MRVTLHNYEPDTLLRQKDGVNLAYNEIAALLAQDGGQSFDVRFHDFLQLCAEESYAREVLSDVDCVISNVGPHAHYYFYLREKLGLNFRIVRDVREAYRSNYLLQEYLCRAYLRGSDIVLFASIYAQEVFFEVFPHLKNLPTAICYPLMRTFPPRVRRPQRDISSAEQITLGYVGRLSEDKNFPQLIDLLMQLDQTSPGKYRLLALGDIHSPSCDPVKVRDRVKQETGRDYLFRYYPPIQHDQVWAFYQQIDAFLFLSTSNIETFGRVLIEASYAGVPIIAADHAAAPELLPEQSLAPVSYFRNRRFSTHYDFPLGRLEVGCIERKLESRILKCGTTYHDYQKHPELFLRLVKESDRSHDLVSQTIRQSQREHCRRFIKSIRLSDLPAPLSIAAADVVMREMVDWFCALQDKHSPGYRSRLDELLRISTHPERTQRYLDKSLKSRGDFTNVGGVDFELCHIAQFYPTFEITEAVQDQEENL